MALVTLPLPWEKTKPHCSSIVIYTIILICIIFIFITAVADCHKKTSQKSENYFPVSTAFSSSSLHSQNSFSSLSSSSPYVESFNSSTTSSSSSSLPRIKNIDLYNLDEAIYHFFMYMNNIELFNVERASLQKQNEFPGEQTMFFVQ
ncbi:hypothetical protein HELRODRAFT_168943 [Helobdella robusta]|uniref:Uncharacterized protein n=1 Tax=Helobdella robusta TaxID=6412 RepID=T1F163_HELRO|nr:hypothetical protein HELRODRAFT_168943 [Helobdella robusta]ESO09011.1 hypothetical protein HELRODRAFT_168943 [Helobdella robusta]